MSFDRDSFEDTLFYSNDQPLTLYERLGYFKQLVFSRTKLEFRLLWNKVFQRDDDELGWLLNPYRQGNQNVEATMMTSFNKNMEDSYQYGFDDVSGRFGRDKTNIYNRSVSKRRDKRRKQEEKKTLSENLFDIARYMGMGVYMTTTSFPSPFAPFSESCIYGGDEAYYTRPQNVYTMSRVW